MQVPGGFPFLPLSVQLQTETCMGLQPLPTLLPVLGDTVPISGRVALLCFSPVFSYWSPAAARKELRGYQSRNGALLASPPAPWGNLLSPQVVPSICQRVC